MNDTALKNFATWARTKLLMDVRTRAATYRIDADGVQADAIARVDGEVLSPQEQRQRADLLRMVRAEGFDALMERAAYTWFNRILAIRFMEVNDRLPGGVRLFSTGEGAFSRRTQAIEEALSLDIEGLDRQQVLDAIQASSDERLFRVLFLAQCAELSACMPAVFEPIGSAMELLLPDNLLTSDGVIQHLVEDIPEQDWREGVEIVGWMYQYYNAERKREVFDDFKKGEKAEAKDIPVATQLFTPEWIVRYFTENTLGRLWMLNYPDSPLANDMPYFIAPDDEDGFQRIANPEEIRVCDPACGSGHVLAYAFDLLAKMYEEAGYSRRDIPCLILEKNLFGFEIDERAVQLANFELVMKACEVDSRFLRRAVQPHIALLRSVTIEDDEAEVSSMLAGRKSLLDAMGHLGECGSLFKPDAEDFAALDDAIGHLESRGENNLFAGSLLAKLKTMRAYCEELTAQFDVVIANPPYMGGKNMNKWLSSWVKKTYPEVKSDLFSCFVVRCMEFGSAGAQIGMMTPYVWMFIGSYEKLRAKLIDECTITSLIQLEYSGFSGATVPICTFTFENRPIADYRGGYVRLSDFVGAENQAPKTLEAIANPNCGWFYRRSAQDFKSIPGTPIAYWASEAAYDVLRSSNSLKTVCDARVGLVSGDGSRFLRFWFEVASTSVNRRALPGSNSEPLKWFPIQKGGDYRLWYGNCDYVFNWENNGWEMKNDNFDGGRLKAHNFNGEQQFKSGITWNSISSSRFHCRYSPEGYSYDAAGPLCEVKGPDFAYVLGFMSSSSFCYFMELMNPTLNFPPGYILSVPFIYSPDSRIISLVDASVGLSRFDWDLIETSWDFVRHPLV